MTFEEYIKNPMGERNAVMSFREMYRQKYTEKFDNLMLREANKLEYKVFIENSKIYYIYLKIPSEAIKDFYYDVVIKFKPTKFCDIEKNLTNYEVQFFSNDPAFVFTFAHSFIKNKLFIESLSPRMSKKAIKEKPKTTNPKEDIGYVKSLYFAYLGMKAKGLFNKRMLDNVATKYNNTALLAMIENADTKIQKRIDKQKELSAQNKVSKAKQTDQIIRDTKTTINQTPNIIKKQKKIGIISGIKPRTIGNNIHKITSSKKSKFR